MGIVLGIIAVVFILAMFKNDGDVSDSIDDVVDFAGDVIGLAGAILEIAFDIVVAVVVDVENIGSIVREKLSSSNDDKVKEALKHQLNGVIKSTEINSITLDVLLEGQSYSEVHINCSGVDESVKSGMTITI